MPIEIEAKHHDPEAKQDLFTTAQRVIEEFPSPPTSRLLVYLDDADASHFREKLGPFNRGFFTPLDGPALEDMLNRTGMRLNHGPDDFRTRICAFDRASLRSKFLCDELVYLHGTTCADPVGMVMTLAHELQHYVQHGLRRDLYKKKFEFGGKLPNFETPIEREARIVSKRVAMRIRGSAKIERYIAKRIDDAERYVKSVCGPNQCSLSPKEIKDWKDEVDDWRFVQHLDISIPYDLEAETSRLLHNLAAC